MSRQSHLQSRFSSLSRCCFSVSDSSRPICGDAMVSEPSYSDLFLEFPWIASSFHLYKVIWYFSIFLFDFESQICMFYCIVLDSYFLLLMVERLH
jgi:hypothetical protein